MALLGPALLGRDGKHKIVAAISVDGRTQDVAGTGNGPIAAFCDALASSASTPGCSTTPNTRWPGRGGPAASYVQIETRGQVLWGVGIDTNTATASMRAIVSAVNRSRRG